MVLGPISYSLETRRPLRQKSSSDHVEVRQGKHRQGTHRVLVQAAVAHLGKAPQAFDDVEGMLTAGAPARAAAVDQLLILAQRLMLAGGTPVDALPNARLFAVLPVILAPIGLIAIEFRLLPVQQLANAADVGLVGRPAHHAMHQALLGGADMKFHAEVPLLTLPGLMHLRIA